MLSSERYRETVAHGLFHLLAITLAFMVGNAWLPANSI
jgi:hypothetical protein